MTARGGSRWTEAEYHLDRAIAAMEPGGAGHAFALAELRVFRSKLAVFPVGEPDDERLKGLLADFLAWANGSPSGASLHEEQFAAKYIEKYPTIVRVMVAAVRAAGTSGGGNG